MPRKKVNPLGVESMEVDKLQKLVGNDSIVFERLEEVMMHPTDMAVDN